MEKNFDCKVQIIFRCSTYVKLDFISCLIKVANCNCKKKKFSNVSKKIIYFAKLLVTGSGYLTNELSTNLH